jgi:hypothetical protein
MYLSLIPQTSDIWSKNGQSYMRVVYSQQAVYYHPMPKDGKPCRCPICHGKAQKYKRVVTWGRGNPYLRTKIYCQHCTKIENARRAKYRQAWHRAKKYGITVEQLKAIIRSQNGRCAICCKVLQESSTHVDHNHETKKVRGALCNLCNAGLGCFHDDSALLLKAIAYLQRTCSA